jgi:hypothetical protein
MDRITIHRRAFRFQCIGRKLYYTWNLDFGEASSAYYARTVDPTTGTLSYLNSSNITQVVEIDLPSKQILDAGSSIPGSTQIYLGQDGGLLYAVDWSDTGGSSTILIYDFDKASGAVTQGGEISQPSLNGVYPAGRE